MPKICHRFVFRLLMYMRFGQIFFFFFPDDVGIVHAANCISTLVIMMIFYSEDYPQVG